MRSIKVRLPTELLAGVEAVATDLGVARAVALRTLIADGISGLAVFALAEGAGAVERGETTTAVTIRLQPEVADALDYIAAAAKVYRTTAVRYIVGHGIGLYQLPEKQADNMPDDMPDSSPSDPVQLPPLEALWPDLATSLEQFADKATGRDLGEEVAPMVAAARAAAAAAIMDPSIEARRELRLTLDAATGPVIEAAAAEAARTTQVLSDTALLGEWLNPTETDAADVYADM